MWYTPEWIHSFFKGVTVSKTQRIDLTVERYQAYLSDPAGLRALLRDVANTSNIRYDVYSPDETLLFSVRPGESVDLDDLLRQMEAELDTIPLGLPRDEAVTAIESTTDNVRLIRGAELQLVDLMAMSDGDLVWVTWEEGTEPEPLVDSPLPIRFGPFHSFVMIGERFLFMPDVYDLSSYDHCVADGFLRREQYAESGSLELYHAVKSRNVNIADVLSDPSQRRECIILGIIALQAREGVEVSYEQAAAAYDDAVARS